MAEEPATPLEPVLVTAPRDIGDDAESPAAVTVLPDAELEAALVETTAELSTRAPNLVVQQGGDRRSNLVQIRGFQNVPLGGEAVGMYVDGIPVVDQRASVFPLYDVEAVEVLRGPQNLRYGRSAEAGTINVLTRPPGATLSARGSVLYGNYDTQIYEGAVDGPLGDHVRFSIAGVESKRNGYIDNTFLDEPLDDRDLLAGRGKLVFLPIPQLELSLTGEAQHADEGSRALVLLTEPDPYEIAYNTPGSERTDMYLGALRAAWSGSLFHLTSVTARRSFDADHSSLDADFTPRDELVFIDDWDVSDWSQELRIRSPDPRARWRWQAGAFFEDTVTRPGAIFESNSTTYIQSPPPAGLGLPFTAPVSDAQRARFHARTTSGFGELTAVVVPNVELIGGLRYQDYTLEMQRTHVFSAPSQGFQMSIGDYSAETGSSAWLPQVTLAYRFRPNALWWANVARGYRPGGFSYVTDDRAAAAFSPQRDWSWETGAKGAWPSHDVEVAATLFYVLSRDFQVTQRTGLTGFTVANADRVTSRGFELSATGRPTRGLALVTSFGYVDARYDEFDLPGSGGSLDGNDVQLVPPYNFSASAEYTHPTGLTARVDYLGLGAYEFTEQNTDGQAAYQLLNVRAGWTGEHFGLYAFGQNLTDEVYFSFPISGGPGGTLIVAPGAPRTFGFQATARF